jgi:hypothetical protein
MTNEGVVHYLTGQMQGLEPVFTSMQIREGTSIVDNR